MVLNRLIFCLAGASSIAGCGSAFFTDGTAGTGGQGMGAFAGSAGSDQAGKAMLGAVGAAESDAGARASMAAGAGGKPEVTPPVDTAGGAGSGGTAGQKSAGGAPTSEGGAPSISGTGSGANAAGSSGDPVIELKGNASASLSQSSNPPSYANDGNPMTRWCEDGRILPVFWQLDLGTSHSLSRVELDWEYPERPFYGYTIGVSDDSIQFPATPAIDSTNNQSTAKTQIATFPVPVSGRYVRITVTSLPPNMLPMETWASLYEVRVFGR